MCARQIMSSTQNKPCTIENEIFVTRLIALYKLEIRATLDNVSGKTDTKMPLSKSKVMVKLNSCGLFNNISFFLSRYIQGKK